MRIEIQQLSSKMKKIKINKRIITTNEKSITLILNDASSYQYTSCIKYLGASCWWNKLVHKAAAKGNRALRFIKRNIKTKSGVTKELAYKALVRPTLEYASTVWSPHLKKLKKGTKSPATSNSLCFKPLHSNG